jgi:hypothetical protein
VVAPERDSDQIAQLFWVDASGAPEAAIVFSDWGRTWSCDPLVRPSRAEDMLPRIWSRALERMDALSLDDVEIAVRDDDGTLRELVMETGFSPSADADLVTTWMRAGDIPPIGALADGFTLHDRLDDPHRVHHMAASRSQNGCPRYTFTALTSTPGWKTQNGRVAAYGLFWFDLITGVELVEPMRTEEKYWRLGLAHHDLTVGLNPLASLGATRAKGQLRKRPPSRRASLSHQRLSAAGLEQGTWAEQGDHHSASTACDRMHVARTTFEFSYPCHPSVRILSTQ